MIRTTKLGICSGMPSRMVGCNGALVSCQACFDHKIGLQLSAVSYQESKAGYDFLLIADS